MPARSDPERSDANLRRHQPHQIPGEAFLERPSVELPPFRGIQRHDPAGMVDGPGAMALTGRGRSTEGVVYGAAVARGIDAGLEDGIRETGHQWVC
jgi:hypothetical protein